MAESFSKEERQRFHSYLKIQLKKEELALPAGKKVLLLEKKNRKQWMLLIFNIAVIMFFGYSFYSGITQLSNTLLYILLAVFVVNIGLIFYQKKRINELIMYLRSQMKS